MNLNSIIFPAPTEDKRYEIFRFKDELMYVPKEVSPGKFIHIPCLLQLSKRKPDSNKYFFYFHGNAEDIFNSTSNLDILRNSLPYHTIAIEYPGYSIYHQEKSASTIEEDCLVVFDYLVKKIGLYPSDIVVCGRSIGSGPAVYLSAMRNPAALILISPFKSIRETVGSICGPLKYMVADRFQNIEHMKKVTCPTLFIHGQKDDLIPVSHSLDLSKCCGGPYDLIFPEDMDHNDFNIYDDFLEPILTFLKRHNLLTAINEEKHITIPSEVFEIPEYLVNTEKETTSSKKKDYISHYLRKFLKI